MLNAGHDIEKIALQTAQSLPANPTLAQRVMVFAK
jgi:hypothetical protein